MLFNFGRWRCSGPWRLFKGWPQIRGTSPRNEEATGGNYGKIGKREKDCNQSRDSVNRTFQRPSGLQKSLQTGEVESLQNNVVVSHCHLMIYKSWREDLNLRPHGPEAWGGSQAQTRCRTCLQLPVFPGGSISRSISPMRARLSLNKRMSVCANERQL